MPDWRGQQGELPLTGLRGDRCIMMVHEANEFRYGRVRLVSHLPRKPIEARMNPVQISVFLVWRPVLILKTCIVFHAAGWAGNGAAAMGCSP
jgi:hypothetical protein